MTALESTDIPLIRRRGFFSGYCEGWALYTEQLADEMGMYDGDPLGQVGYLQSLLFRATRLVVDSGMHAKRWSREKATDLPHRHHRHRPRPQPGRDRPLHLLAGAGVQLQDRPHQMGRTARLVEGEGRRELGPAQVPQHPDPRRHAARGAGTGGEGRGVNASGIGLALANPTLATSASENRRSRSRLTT